MATVHDTAKSLRDRVEQLADSPAIRALDPGLRNWLIDNQAELWPLFLQAADQIEASHQQTMPTFEEVDSRLDTTVTTARMEMTLSLLSDGERQEFNTLAMQLNNSSRVYIKPSQLFMYSAVYAKAGVPWPDAYRMGAEALEWKIAQVVANRAAAAKKKKKKKRKRKNPGRPTASVVQSVGFQRSEGWTPTTAREWLGKHTDTATGEHFKNSNRLMDITDDYIWVRQRQPKTMRKDSYTTGWLSEHKGIRARFAMPSGRGGRRNPRRNPQEQSIPEQRRSLLTLERQALGFREWLDDWLDDSAEFADAWADEELRLEYLTDYLLDEFSIEVREDGLIAFDVADEETSQILQGLPVVLYHHTASGALPGIKQRGLRTARQLGIEPEHMDTGGYVYLTTETGGPAVQGYLNRAVRRFGGRPVTLEIATNLYEVQPDPDDEDISSGTRQFVLGYVGPERIVW